jgi:hypothetical protein
MMVSVKPNMDWDGGRCWRSEVGGQNDMVVRADTLHSSGALGKGDPKSIYKTS